MKNRRTLGRRYEEKAARFLEEQKFILLKKNIYLGSQELDIVAKDGDVLVFVEVKYRKEKRDFNPLRSIPWAKRQNIIRAAGAFLQNHTEFRDAPTRYDAVIIVETQNGKEKLHYIKDAFRN